MNGELIKREPTALDRLLADPERLKEFPIETLERMMALAKDQRAEQARLSFFVAFNSVQEAMTPVRKTAENAATTSLYAKLETVTKMLDPLLIGWGFSRSLTTEPSTIDEHIRFVIVIRHVEGHEERYGIDAPNDYAGPKGALVKTKLHGMGSSFTYCERILLCKAFAVQIVSDDDGQAGSGVGPSAVPITADQADDLATSLDDAGGDLPRFLALFGISALSALPASSLKTAHNFVNLKRATKEKA